jgi:hypothetical protein
MTISLSRLSGRIFRHSIYPVVQRRKSNAPCHGHFLETPAKPGENALPLAACHSRTDTNILRAINGGSVMTITHGAGIHSGETLMSDTPQERCQLTALNHLIPA